MKRMLDALTEGPFDLLVLGGGITGAGVALDAVLRGLRVALIDKGDFAGGTSSISSKLVHGGLRYLEHGDFRLVYEALHERRRLLRNAPHLVHPLRFVLPFYAGARVPPWKWRLGLLLYDILAGTGNIHRSRSLPLARLRREFPDLERRGLLGGAEYFDAQMDDARLCLEVVLSAARQGAVIANYVEAVAFEKSGSVLCGVRARDHLGGREFSIAARQILNATGPWADAVRRLAGDDTGPVLRPTRGVHLVAPGSSLASEAGFLLLHPADGRVFFVLPWLGKTLIGTTDTACDESPDAVLVTPADVAYLLDGYNHYFAPVLRPTDLLSTFAGLRPLLRSGSVKGARAAAGITPSCDKGARAAAGITPGRAPSDLTREFHLFASPSGLLTAGGGKYTTYRHMAEIITDAVVARLGTFRPCRTRNFRLEGAPDTSAIPWPRFAAAAAAELCARFSLDSDSARHLVQRYGRRAFDVATCTLGDPGLRRRVVAGEPDLLAEFAYQRDQEMACRPEDFLLRRTRLGLFHPELLRHPPAELLASEGPVRACG
jgi:glycerol-3-phosphate dehydrogenase